MIHGNTQETRAQRQKIKDLHRLQSIYQTRHLLEPSVQDLLFDTIEEHHQQRSSTTIHNWLSIHETTFIQSVKQASKRAIQGVRSLKTYFSPLQPRSNPTQPSPNRQVRRQPLPVNNFRHRPLNTILSYIATGRPPDHTSGSKRHSANQSIPELNVPSPA